MSDFYKRLTELCIKKSITITSMLKDIGASTQSKTKWKNGTIPNGEMLVKVAEYLDTSIDYLLRGIPATDDFDPLTKEIIVRVEEMNTVQKAELLTELNKKADEIADRKEKKSS